MGLCIAFPLACENRLVAALDGGDINYPDILTTMLQELNFDCSRGYAKVPVIELGVRNQGKHDTGNQDSQESKNFVQNP